MFGFDNGRSRYRHPGDPGMVTMQDATNSNASNGGGILGFFGGMFSGSSSSSRSSSSGYLQPAASPSGDVVVCQPIEGVACQPMAVCQPVEGVACAPVMVQAPLPGP